MNQPNNENRKYHLTNLNNLNRFKNFYNVNNYSYVNHTRTYTHNTGNDERYFNYNYLLYHNNVSFQEIYDNKKEKEEYELFNLTNYRRKKKLLDTLISPNVATLQKYNLIYENTVFIGIKKINISEGGLFNDYYFPNF